MRRLTDLAVPHVADWCVIGMLGADGRLERFAVAHADPEKVAKASWFEERFPPDPDAPHGPTQVVRTGETELIWVESRVGEGSRLTFELPAAEQPGATARSGLAGRSGSRERSS
ncbi:MAG TPA: hypothetical protein VGJ40_04670 [Gaiellaceae bacterium]|jgi:hypothetical protein